MSFLLINIISYFKNTLSDSENTLRFAIIPKKVISKEFDFIPVQEKWIFFKFFEQTPKKYGFQSCYALDCFYDN